VNSRNIITAVLLVLVLAACGPQGDRFRLEGRLRNMNQAEFFVYSPDGAIVGIDTIPVREGRFSYETELRIPATLIVIFPNYSELPIFAEPGKAVSIKGDATHLKEIVVKGTDANEQMTGLRTQLNKLMPPEVRKAVAAYVTEHPESPVSNYLLQRYFLLDAEPDYAQAATLLKKMQKAQPDNGQIVQWAKAVERLKNGAVKGRMPNFSATDIKGRSVTQGDLHGKVNVLSLWASWSFPSTDIQRRLTNMKRNYGDKLGVVSICLDADAKGCRRRLERDSIMWKTVCDGRMWSSPLLATFGFANVPSNLLIDDKGIIVAADMDGKTLEEEINKRMKN
jgi:hypothetical protein